MHRTMLKVLIICCLLRCFLCDYHMVAISGDILTSFDSNHARLKRDTSDQNLVPNITKFFVSSNVKARFATVQIESHVRNQQATSLDTTFAVQLPESAFIANFSMNVNGSWYIAKIYPKEEAQKIYDDAKAKNQSAGQVRHSETDKKRGMDIFNIDVNIAAGAEAVFYLTYQEFIERRLGQYKQRIVLQPGQVVKNLKVNANVNENQGFEEFGYRLPNSDTVLRASSDQATLTASPNSRVLTYNPTEAEQLASSTDKGVDGEVVITYDVIHSNDGGVVIIEDEYFAHFVSPSGLETMDKNILFVIDVSGSMGGRKIQDARDTMLKILDRLNTNDYFNLLTFESSIRNWQEVPVTASSQNIDRAKKFVVDYVVSGGGTNINDALLHAVRSLKRLSEQSRRANVIVFLTDGQPSSGVTDTKQIRKNVYQENYGLASIFCLGFGFDVDFTFLKNLAYENGGFARRIYEAVDATDQIQNFYLEVKNPLLQNLVINYGENVVVSDSMTKTNFYQYFEGSEIVVAGKTRVPEVLPPEKLSVIGVSKTGDVDLKIAGDSVIIWSEDTGLIEKLWAYKKIKELLDKYYVNKNETVKSLALNMSLEYNFVTPLTSFVLVEKDEFQAYDNRKVFKGTGGTNVYANSPGNSARQWHEINVAFLCLLVVLSFLF